MPLSPSDRRTRIADLVGAHARMSVDDLAGLLSVSRETIRRDLGVLDRRGLVRKLHGGAVTPDQIADLRGEGPFHARMSEQTDEKRAIARRAAMLFQPGDTLFVDAGSTTQIFAEQLARRPGLTVITNSLAIAQFVARGSGESAAFLIGGRYRDDVGENLGPVAIETIANFQAVHAVLTIGGLGLAGAMDHDPDEAAVARAMIARSQRVTIIADATKFMRDALLRVCALEDIDRLVCDRAPAGALADRLAQSDVEVIASTPIAGDKRIG